MPRRACLLALLAACASPPALPPPPLPPTAPALPTPVRFVAQPFALARERFDPWLTWELAPTADGSLLAAYGPELRIVDTATGLVRGRLVDSQGAPICATEAAFSPDAATLAVLGCSTGPGDHLQGGPTPVVDVHVWDLAKDAVRSIASGPFAHVAFTADGSAIELTGGEHRVIGLADGKPRPLPPGWTPPPNRPHALLSPDGGRLAWIDGGHVKIEDRATGAEIARRPLPPRCRILGWRASRRGARLPVDCMHGSGEITILDAAGAVLCTIGPRDLPANRRFGQLTWSRDGERFAVEIYGDGWGDGAGFAVYRAEGCLRERFRPDAKLSTYLEWSGDLVGFDAPSMNGRYHGVLRMVPPEPDPSRVLSDRLIPPFVRVTGDRLVAELGFDVRVQAEMVQRWDPRLGTIQVGPAEEDAPLTTKGGVLHAVSADGRALPIVGPAPLGIAGKLAVIDSAGHRTMLERSEAYASRADDGNGHLSRFWSSRGGAFVASLAEVPPASRPSIAIWNARTGRRTAEIAGNPVLFSADETRAAVEDWFVEPRTVRVLDTATGRKVVDLAVTTPPEVALVTAWSGTGALLAVSGVGVVDGGTGKVLWAHQGGFPEQPCSPRGDRIVSLGQTFSAFGLGPLEVREARTGALVGTIEGNLEGWSADGSLFLVRVRGGFREARDATTLAVRARVGPARSAALSEDGRFLFHQGTDALRLHRLADGAELYLVPPDREGEIGLAYTASGLFDGGPEALRWVTFRSDRDVRKGRLLRLDEVRAEGHRPGLAADFFAGRPIDPAPAAR